MDCRLFERRVQLYLDGLLSALEQEDMLLHAQVCPYCATFLQEMTDLNNLLCSRLTTVEPPVGFATTVMATLPDLYHTTKNPVEQLVIANKIKRPVWQRWGTLAAAAALLIAVGVYSFWLNADTNTNTDTLFVNNPNANIIAKNEDIPAIIPTPQENQPSQLTFDNPEAILEPDEQIVITDLLDPQEVDAQQVEPQAEEAPNTITSTPIVVAEIDEPFEGFLDLPSPAYEIDPPQLTNDMFTLSVLAAYKDCDAILPSLNKDGLVEFYTKYKNNTYCWTQSLTAQEDPEYQDQVKVLPAISEIIGNVDMSAIAGFPYISSVSPDGRLTVVNRGGEDPGIWLYTNTAQTEVNEEALIENNETGVKISASSGSRVLCWSADSNKLLYVDNAGKLFAYYLFAPQNTMLLFEGIVDCASWANDSKTILFSGKPDKRSRSAIYSIIVP